MKTLVRQTSIEAYHSQDLTGQRREVYQALQVLGTSCIADIAAYLNMERSTVSGRLNELKHHKDKNGEEKPLVICVGKRPSQRTGVNSEHWRVKQYQTSLFN